MKSNEANTIHFNAGFVQMSLNWVRLSLGLGMGVLLLGTDVLQMDMTVLG